MRKMFVGARLALPFLLAAIAVGGCGTTSDAGSGAQAPVSGQPAAGGQPAAAAAQTAPASPYYTGEGGRGKSLTILPPKAAGLAADQAYLPGVVQGELVSNFSGYSAISVLDREKLDAVYDELFSGYYDERAEAAGDLGHLTPAKYIVGGGITKTAPGYALQLQITRTADKMTAASYSGACTFAELDNLSGVRRAAPDLLEKMGVEPTARAKAELAGAATEKAAEAQVALSKGIEAMKNGTGRSGNTRRGGSRARFLRLFASHKAREGAAREGAKRGAAAPGFALSRAAPLRAL